MTDMGLSRYLRIEQIGKGKERDPSNNHSEDEQSCGIPRLEYVSRCIVDKPKSDGANQDDYRGYDALKPKLNIDTGGNQDGIAGHITGNRRRCPYESVDVTTKQEKYCDEHDTK